MVRNNIYVTGGYLEATQTWHAEDSPWKARQISQMIRRNEIQPRRVAEIGCGAGNILGELGKEAWLKDCRFIGYDISPQAIELCESVKSGNVSFFCGDMFAHSEQSPFDMLLVIDVFEHIPDYMGFLEQCKRSAEYKVYHIPLDIHISSVLRRSFLTARYSIGHLHYFSAESAIATLRDTGHEVLETVYTAGALGLFRNHPSFKTAIANVPRWCVSKLSVSLAARIFGGYSLLVLAR